MDSWLGSFISGYHWKWIYNLPRLQQTKSPHQNQRVYCFTCRGGFLCWFERYSFSVFLQLYKHLNIISWLFSNTSVVNLCVLVLDRFIAIVHPPKYITLMTRRRITESIFFSWVLAVSYNALQDILCIVLYQNKTCPFAIWLTIIYSFRDSSMCYTDTLLWINDISCMQA